MSEAAAKRKGETALTRRQSSGVKEADQQESTQRSEGHSLLSGLYEGEGFALNRLSPTTVVVGSLGFMMLVIVLHFLAVTYRIAFGG